ncbi:hypothetical protein GOBAR_AA23955 [Gossypium barbadense]|uniref:Beta-glucosidase n=1 Tax=Gossypium barbadense TaxID=3634 RepID=A0A2P5X081_GOSBA|nr:hypothetical protein GOBAR_AA23955 [Gossypium barbadense]
MNQAEETMSCVYKNPNAPTEDRIKDLVSRMTLQEKVGQMTQIELCVATLDDVRNLSIGSMVSGAGKEPLEKAMASDWAETIDRFQQAAVDSRLGIPLAYGIDAVHGNNRFYGATIFPHNIGLGATGDADLAQRIGAAVALEVRASGIHFNFAPCRCLQGQPPVGHPKGYPFVAGRYNVIACAKHFVGDGGTEKGINEGNTISSFDELESVHMAPYLDCLYKGVSTVMASYSSWNECKLHAHHFLLTEILKGKLGFKGFLISDWKALDRLSEPRGSNYHRCVYTAINAGIDMVMLPYRYKQFIEDLISLVESGEIQMTRIDDAVERILRVKFVAGNEEEEYKNAIMKILALRVLKNLIVIGELAREAVRKSLVLLKNGKNPGKPFLPLEKNAERVLITGTHANNLGYQCGGWTRYWQGSSGRITTGTTILDAFREVMGEKTDVIYEKYPSPNTLSGQNFSFAIVGVGEEPYAESAGDNSELVIPLNGSELISTIADRIPTLVILISGRPLVIEPWLLEKIDALVAAWLPGTEARGITDVVFGDYEFEGRLPMTWFRTTEELPINKGDNSCDPLFPLGFGLTYKKEKPTE